MGNEGDCVLGRQGRADLLRRRRLSPLLHRAGYNRIAGYMLMITTDNIVLDCINKGYEVTFRWVTAGGPIECCIEREGQFPGGKPFSSGNTLLEAAVFAARYASVAGY